MYLAGRVFGGENKSRLCSLFTNWQAAAGFEFEARYALGSGDGLAIVASSSSAAMHESLTPWVEVFIDFDRERAIDISEAVPISQASMA